MTEIPDLVSTIIPVYNRPDMLRQAVASVLEQTYRPIQIIIADDGSTDNTLDVAHQLRDQHPDIIKVTTKENSGPGPTREAGRLIADGEFLQYLDSDDRLLPNKFADQVGVLRKHPDCGIAYGITRLVNQDGEVLADPFKWTDRQIPTLFPGLLVDRWWCTHTPLYRRTLTDRIGAWCGMRWSQDWEYDARAAATNVQLVHCQSAVSEHVHHDGDRQTSSAAWTTDPVRLKNRTQLLSALWSNALIAGAPADIPERQHFSRWCFMIARQCASQGLSEETRTCMTLAAESAGDQGTAKKGLKAFHVAVSTLGTRMAGKLFCNLERFKNQAGTATLNQSFSGQVESQDIAKAPSA